MGIAGLAGNPLDFEFNQKNGDKLEVSRDLIHISSGKSTQFYIKESEIRIILFVDDTLILGM